MLDCEKCAKVRTKRTVPESTHPHPDNIICLPGQPTVAAHYPFRVLWEGEMLMSTYEEMQIMLTVALLVVAILNLKNKK